MPPLERADVVSRVVAIPSGNHLVEMPYRMPALRAGVMVASAA